jgi:hypothetical protein
MLLLDDDSGQHLVPGEMMQADVLELQVVDLGGWGPICHGRSVGDGEQGLKSVPASYLQIVLLPLTS